MSHGFYILILIVQTMFICSFVIIDDKFGEI